MRVEFPNAGVSFEFPFVEIIGGLLIAAIFKKKKEKRVLNMSVKESKEAVAMVVSIVKGFEAAKEAKFGLAAVLTQVISATPAIAAGVQGLGQVDDELKALDEAGIKEIVAEAMLGFDGASEKTKLYVEQSVIIVLATMKMIKA